MNYFYIQRKSMFLRLTTAVFEDRQCFQELNTAVFEEKQCFAKKHLF